MRTNTWPSGKRITLNVTSVSMSGSETAVPGSGIEEKLKLHQRSKRTLIKPIWAFSLERHTNRETDIQRGKNKLHRNIKRTEDS